MAVQYSCFAPMAVFQKSVSTKRPSSSIVVMCCKGDNISINSRTTTSFQIRLPSTSNKVVFEDQAEGIVCYSNENGEIICEGFDEGPRFQQLNSTFVSNSRNADIVELLQKWWIQTGGDAKFC